MAELLSVQIHVPSVWAGSTAGAPGTATSGSAAAASVLKKVDNRTVQAAKAAVGGPAITLKHLPKRRPIDIEFKDLTYSVSEGRKRGIVLAARVCNFCRAMLCISAAYAVVRCTFLRLSVRHVHVLCQKLVIISSNFFTFG